MMALASTEMMALAHNDSHRGLNVKFFFEGQNEHTTKHNKRVVFSFYLKTR